MAPRDASSTDEPSGAIGDLVVEERRFAAMGTRVHIMVVSSREAASDIAYLAAHRVDELEARWSRFRSTSEISVMNRSAGTAVAVSADTLHLVAKAVEAWELTGGAYDPTVLRALEANGYDRSFETIDAGSPAPTRQDPQPAPGCAGIVIDSNRRTILLPESVGFDPGGIGKGLAADLIVAEALADGAEGALVSLGGDAVARGQSPTGAGWTILVEEDTISSGPLATLAFTEGAVATSVTTRRTWGANREHHHLVDPSTGTSAETNIQLVTVLAPEGWLAEVVAKAHLTCTLTPAVASVPALLLDRDGKFAAHAGIERFLAHTAGTDRS